MYVETIKYNRIVYDPLQCLNILDFYNDSDIYRSTETWRDKEVDRLTDRTNI